MKRRGFSFAELVISVMILSTIAIILLAVVPSSIIGLRRENQRATAAWLARDLLEQLRALQVQRMKVGPGTNVTCIAGGFNYTVAYEVSPTSGGNFPNDGTGPEGISSYQVDIAVSWEFRNQKRLYQSTTVLSRSQ